MGDRLPNDTLHSGAERPLRYAAAALTYVVAAVHLFHPTHGVGRLALVLAVDPGLLVADPRPALFVLAGIAMVLAVPAASMGFPRRLLYGLGLALMATFVVGYFAWHLSGHGGFLPGREPLYHGLAPHEAVISHLGSDPWAAVAVVTEVALAGLFVWLLTRDRG